MEEQITFGDVERKVNMALENKQYDTAKKYIRYFLSNFLDYLLKEKGITTVPRKKSKSGAPTDYDKICALEDLRKISKRYAGVLHSIRKSANDISHIDDEQFIGTDEDLVNASLEANYRAYIVMVATMYPDYKGICFNQKNSRKKY